MTHNIALGFSELYSVAAQVLTYSVLKNNPKLDLKFFYIIKPDFDKDEKRSLERNLNIFKQNFPKFDYQIIPMPEKIDNYLIERFHSYTWPRLTLYCCFVDQILPKDVDSVLYLDCDTICDGKLDQLFEYYDKYQVQNPQNNKIIFSISHLPMQAVQKVKAEYGLDDYFQACTLLMNLKNWRKNKEFQKKLLEEVDKGHYSYDQDSFNIACHNDLYQNISRIYGYLFVYDIIDPKPNPVLYAYGGEYPLKKQSNQAWWLPIAQKFKIEILYLYLRNFVFNTILRKNIYDYKLSKFSSSAQVIKKARKTFFKYYDPYLELVKDDNSQE